MPNAAFKSLIDGFNAQIKAMNDNNFRVYDADNLEYFISGIEYNSEDDIVIFKTEEDKEVSKRLYSSCYEE
jgi:pyruvate-formate lyase-activating enzyme